MGLKIENLNKSYGDFKALKNISFEAESGQILGILGRNGAGKTTTIKSIMGIIEPESGNITFDDVDIRKSKTSIGYLPEERGLYVNANVKDQLMYFAMLNGMTKEDASSEIKKRLKEFGISQYINSKVKTLSKGNKQKIQLISAILHKPEIVILDEPFSGLDPVNIELFKTTVKNLKKEGATILFSSHRMEDVEEMCDRIVMVKKGEIIENNTVEGLIDKYSNGNEVEIETDGDIAPFLEPENVKVTEQNGNHFVVNYNTNNSLQKLYQNILLGGRSIREIRDRKVTLQTIFLKELAD